MDSNSIVLFNNNNLWKIMTEFTGEIRPLDIDLSILKDLNLEDQPVGVKFMFDKPEGIKRLDKNLAICVMAEEVQSLGAFYVDAGNFECAEALWLGFANDDPASTSGQIGTKDGLDIFQEARANRRIYDHLPVLRPGSCNYMVFAALDQLDFSPDVLVITGNARQVEVVMRSYTYSTGKMYVSKTTPVIGCAWTFAYPYITGELNYVVEGLCFGHIARAVSTPGYVTVSIPFDLIKPMMENLKEMTWNLPSYNDGREGYNERFKAVTSGRLVQR